MEGSGSSSSSINKHYPSLPSNYVSLAQLQERWLQQQQDQKQPPEKQKQENFHNRNRRRNKNGEPRVEGDQKGVYVSRSQVLEDGNFRETGGDERKLGASGGFVEGVDRMEKKMKGKAYNYSSNNSKKRTPRVKGSAIIGEKDQHRGNGDDDQRIAQVGKVCKVEVSPGNEVQEHDSVGLGRKNGEGRFRGRYQRKVKSNSGKGRVSEDNQVELGRGKFEEVEEGVFVSENERNRDQKGRTGGGIQAYGYKERVSGNFRPKIGRDLRVLSLDDSREGNVTSRKGLPHGGRLGRSRDGGLVWVKKERSLETNASSSLATQVSK